VRQPSQYQTKLAIARRADVGAIGKVHRNVQRLSAASEAASRHLALIAALPIGLMGGIATAAYLDLIIRSCPPGLQGTTLMMSGGLYFIAARFGDVLGTNLYDYGSFSACVIAITVVYALILPTLLLVPKRLIATTGGQTPDFSFAAG
jgi:hypothetical protein